jgi:hypothetical protein
MIVEDFLVISTKRLIWMTGAVHTVAWPFKLEDTITGWTSTHVWQTIIVVIFYLPFAWLVWDLGCIRFKEAVSKAMRAQPLSDVDVEALGSQVGAGSDLETD